MAVKASGLLEVNDVAELLNCNKKHVYELIRKGELETYRIGKRVYRISRESVIKILESKDKIK